MKKEYLRMIILVLSCLSYGQLKAQDISYSQVYASPLYLSPSFTGLTNGSRVSLTYRDQWPGIPNTYRTYSLAADHYFEDYNSGVGLMFLRDDSGDGKLVRQDVSALYAYEFEVYEGIFVRPGIQFKYSERNVNLIDAVMPSDLGSDGSVIPGSIYGNEYNKKFFDAAASGMIYSDFFWFGVAVDNLIKNDISVTDIETYTPIKTSIYGGYKFSYTAGRSRTEQSLTAAFNYRMQQGFNQLDFGAYWFLNPMELGLWYRGIPFASQGGLMNNDGLIFILGVNVGNIRFAYSYDLTLSELSGYSNGANELSLIFRFNQNFKRREVRGAIPCSAPTYGTGTSSKYRRRTRKIF